MTLGQHQRKDAETGEPYPNWSTSDLPSESSGECRSPLPGPSLTGRAGSTARKAQTRQTVSYLHLGGGDCGRD